MRDRLLDLLNGVVALRDDVERLEIAEAGAALWIAQKLEADLVELIESTKPGPAAS